MSHPFEAMAAGRTLIVSDGPGDPEAVRAGPRCRTHPAVRSRRSQLRSGASRRVRRNASDQAAAARSPSMPTSRWSRFQGSRRC